jgi:aminopeptidase N
VIIPLRENEIDDTNNWIIGNIQHSGFYRVNYNQHNWNLLIEQLNNNHELIHPINRGQLLDDSFNLGRSTILDQIVFLNITKYLVKELHTIPFQVVLKEGFDYIETMLQSNYTQLVNFQKYCRFIYQNNYNRLAWNTSIDQFNEV